MSFGNSAEPDLTAAEVVEGDPVYRIFVLGARGSGKTVFLSALYGYLVTQNPVNQFAVEVSSASERRILQSCYDRICNPELPWPDGDQNVKEFEFQCVHRRAGERFPLFRIKYHDYPGSYVTEGYIDGAINIEHETQRAHSILVLIDGRKVFEKLEGYAPDGDTLESDLNAIIPMLEYSAQKPIHFLVTKWDILRGLHSFSSVKNVLMGCDLFSNFVHSRNNSTVRLIPVSAVGSDFAKFDFSTKRMVKLKGKSIRPYNVDLSIVLTLMDQLSALGRTAIAQKKIPYWIVKGLRSGTFLSRLLLNMVNLRELQISHLKIKLQPMQILSILSEAEANLSALEEKIKRRIARARDRKDASQAIFQAQAWRMLKFTKEFPEFGLTGATETWLPNIGHS